MVVAVLIGIMLGIGASKLHPAVNAGGLMAAAAGALGGLLGGFILGPVFASLFSDVAMAGLAAGAATGGAALALGAGFAWNRFRSA
jgi:hypothetical protein